MRVTGRSEAEAVDVRVIVSIEKRRGYPDVNRIVVNLRAGSR
jgi:hypothetical protein